MNVVDLLLECENDDDAKEQITQTIRILLENKSFKDLDKQNVMKLIDLLLECADDDKAKKRGHLSYWAIRLQ